MPGIFCARRPATRRRATGPGLRGVLSLLPALALILASGAARAVTTYTIGGQDLLSDFDGTSGILTFDDGATGEAGIVDDAGGIPGLFVGAEVWFEAVLSPKRFNGTTDFDAASATPTGRVTRGNFLKSENPTLRIVDNSGMSPVALLVFEILVSLDDMDGGGNLPRGGVKTEGASTPVMPNDPDGFVFIGSLDIDCGGDLCRNEVVLTGGTLAGAVGGIGSMAHLHVRMDSLNPTLGSLNGYYGSDFDSGTGSFPNPTEWDLTIVPIPEPATAQLVGVALAGLATFGHRRLRGTGRGR